jgi:hypothetical protein
MSEFSAPFVVASSFRLPGLGLLVLPAAPLPHWLAIYDLHTALAITLPPGIQPHHSIIGTVEEVSQDDQAQRALLLDFDPDTSLAPGIHLQASETHLDLQ